MGHSLVENLNLRCPWCGMLRIPSKHGGFLEDHCRDHIENGDTPQFSGFVEADEMAGVA